MYMTSCLTMMSTLTNFSMFKVQIDSAFCKGYQL